MITSIEKFPCRRNHRLPQRRRCKRSFPAALEERGTIGVKPDCAKSPNDCKWVEILGSDRETYGLSDQAYTKELADIFFEVQDGVIAGRYAPEDAAKTMQSKSEAWKAANPG